MKTTINYKTALLLSCSLALSACGGSSNQNENTVTTNQAPVISGTPNTATKAGNEFNFTPSASDGDNDVLTFTIENQPNWADFDSETGQLSGIPQINDMGNYSNVMISVSDGQAIAELPTFDINVIRGTLSKDNIQTIGSLTEIQVPNSNNTAYIAEGTTTINVGEKQQVLNNSTLRMEYDAEGNLIDLAGETDLPPEISDNLAINTQAKARIGMFKGREINADPDFGITLQDDFDYFVFYVGTSTDITVGNQEGGFGESLTLSPPVSGELLFIFDPTDVFYYYFASIPFIGEAGYGQSANGFIPFIPTENYQQLDSFDGHIIEKMNFGIGFKIFDFFELNGTRVIRLPVPSDINWEKPLESEIEFKAGLNGDASFAFSVLSVGLFEFDLASASATFDVSLDRQHFAMQTTIAPDVSWQPDWFPIFPKTEIIGNWKINPKTGFEASLTGSFESTLPAAEISGAMHLKDDSAKFTASIPDPKLPMSMSATFANNETHVEILANVDMADNITQSVTETLDQELVNLEDAINNASNALRDYEFEVSLRGLRSALPNIVDTAVSALSGIPDTAYTTARNGVINYVNNYETCTTVIVTVCTNPLDPLVDESALGTTVGNTARTRARNIVNPIIDDLQDLKRRAQQADNEQLRAGLKIALQRVYDNRRIQATITAGATLPLVGFRTFYTRNLDIKVIPDDPNNNIQAQLLVAINNVHRIQETSDLVFNTNAIIDALPTEEVLNQAKQEVQNGLAIIPVFKGAGYTVSNGNYIAYILLGDEKISVDFNILNPAEALAGISKIISESLTQ